MSLVLTILNGDRAAETFPLADGLTIGRQDADVALSDRRVSGLHAYVRGDDNGGWMVVDNGSKNGIRNGRGERTESVTLRPLTQFTIGDVVFRVDLVDERRPAAGDDRTQISPREVTVPRRPSGPAVPAPIAPEAASASAKAKRYWHEVLATFLDENSAKFKDQPRGLTALEPALVLEFARGPQVNSKWILGYGPRRVGPGALDLPLWGENLPDVCFEIFPSPDGLLFKTAHPDLVQLNGRAIESEVLRMGDVIQINDTIIEVDFNE